jgi:hypothetical protein
MTEFIYSAALERSQIYLRFRLKEAELAGLPSSAILKALLKTQLREFDRKAAA